MADFENVVSNEQIAAVADAIRHVTRTSDSMTIPQMPERLSEIRATMYARETVELQHDATELVISGIDTDYKHLLVVIPATSEDGEKLAKLSPVVEGSYYEGEVTFRISSPGEDLSIGLIVIDYLLAQSDTTAAFCIPTFDVIGFVNNKFETKAEAAAANAQKIDKLTGKTGYIPIFDSNGNIISSGLKLNDPTAHHYMVRWDMKNPQMERLNDAAGIATDTSKFLKYEGTAVSGYSNPFDNIYPWSERKLCNIGLGLYHALSTGESLTKCVKAWEGDGGFSYADTSGVWVYTPEFWGKSWIEGGYQYFDVTDKECYGYTRYPERIEGRWHGVKNSWQLPPFYGVDLLLPLSNGIPVGNISHKDMVKLARNYGATVDTVESLDANIMLYLVEFAHMNCQVKVGYGVTNSVYLEAKANTYLAYNYSQGVYESNNGGGNTIKVRAGYEDYFIPGAVIDIPWAGDQRQFRRIVSVTSPGSGENEQWFTVTLDQATGRSVWYDTGIAIRGMANVPDENIGSKSGYIGTNGKCIAYYRGQELWGNRFSIVLGCSNRYGMISYDKAGIAYHEPVSDGYIANTGLDRCRVNAALGATAVQSTEDYDANLFVSDYCWVNPDPTKKTFLLQGGSCTQYAGPNGLFCQSWDRDFDFVSPAHNSARPCLIKP